MSNPFRVLIAAAFSPELQRFRALRPKVGTAELGIGLLASALAAARLPGPPAAVVLLGTCGAYPATGLSIGDRVVVTASRMVDPSVVVGTASSLVEESSLRSADSLVETFASVGQRVTCATTLSLTTDRSLGEAIARATGAAVEHLETHGVAVACASLGVPFVALLAVANHVGPEGRVEWRAHHREVEDALGEAVAALVG